MNAPSSVPSSKQTPSQTVGPFFAFGLLHGGENILTDDEALGPRILVRGQVLDGDGAPMDDALVEIWQADSQGIHKHPEDPRIHQADAHFRGFGRAGTANPDREYIFKTVKPGPVEWEADRVQAPHIDVRVFARGMLLHAITRLYFSDEPSNNTDPLLASIEDPVRRQTLIASREETSDLPAYRFDIRLQGNGETIFFEP